MNTSTMKSSVIDVVTGERTVPQSRIEALLLDTKDAIDKLGEVLEHIATIESNDYSENHYNIGEYLIWNGRLYQTIQEIQIGDQFEVSTNLRLVVFGDEIEIINAILDDIKEMITSNVEDTQTASRSYITGNYLIYNNTLYKVLNNISQGGTIITTGSDNNVVKTTICDIFNSIVDTIPLVTTTSNGLMSAEDKRKLNGISSNANNYSPIQRRQVAVSVGPQTNMQLDFGSSVNVPGLIVDPYGFVTDAANRTLTIPDDIVTQSKDGLMSASDKRKLDDIARGAQVNTVRGVKGNAEAEYRTGLINITPANIGAASAASVANQIASNNGAHFLQYGDASNLITIANEFITGQGHTGTFTTECNAKYLNGYLNIYINIETTGAINITSYDKIIATFNSPYSSLLPVVIGTGRITYNDSGSSLYAYVSNNIHFINSSKNLVLKRLMHYGGTQSRITGLEFYISIPGYFGGS